MRKTKQVKISTSSSGDLTLEAADTNNAIFLLALHLQAGGTTNVKITDGTNDLSGAVPMASGGHPINWGFNPCGHCRAPAGSALVLNNSAAIAIAGVATIGIGDPHEAF
jgi:hypothetical protein